MADVQSNIKVSIDTTEALASIKNLQRQISAFHTSMAKGGAAANAVTAQMQQGLINSINATGKFSAQMKTIRTTTESFTNSLEKNKFTLGEYFRYAGGASKTFGKLFKTEFDTINKVARENVKDLQTQYIKMGRDANGAMKAIAVRPLSLDMNDLATKTMIASEKQALLNQLLKQGSTNLLNFGKNTQWAGRQLMVGFTLPLISLGAAASKTFMDMETQAIRFKKVYGDLLTPQEESVRALKNIQELGKEFTKYGIAVSSTVGLAAEAAAAGFQGVDLQRQTAAATKLSILGQVESQKALETTIALQNAFSMSSENLAESIDFLNAVENQTVLSLDDVSTAIPKAAPIVQQLGGDVKDLAFFMTAMKEGGINASEGANALKSGLASLINPTGKAAAMLEGFGINAKKIVVDNKGDLKKTVIEFATALNQLDPLNRAQAIEQMFGKFQFSRLSTLFANVTKEGTQAARVLDLAGSSVQELAALSEKELGMTSESAMNKFKASVENLKLALVPVGEEFLKAVTPIAQFVTRILEGFNNLGDNTKKIIVTLTAIVAGLGPVLLMTFGLLANGLANIIKGFTAMKTLFNRTGQSSATLGTEVKYMTLEQRNAAAVAASLDQVHRNLAQTFTAEATSVDRLTAAYARSIAAQKGFMPTGVPLGRGAIKKRAKGKPAVVGGTGNQDSELAFLMPGETVIPTKMSKKYGSLINGMIADNIPGYRKGLGTGTAVDIPGGFAAAHFGGSEYRSGADLLSMVQGLDTAFARQIRTMVAEVEGGLDRIFTVFSNEVIGTSTELNRAVGKTGSGKTASIDLAKRDLIGSGAATRDIELQRQLESAGVSIDEIRGINKKVTESIKVGFKKLGGKATVTAEELDRLVDDAYSEVAKQDSRVAEARNRMKNITAVTDPRNDSRVALSKDPYTKARKSGKYYAGMERSVGAENVPYQRNARFKITNQMADEIGLSSGDAARVYKQFSDEVKVKLAGLRGDITKFSAEFAKEAEIAGLKTGSAYKVGLDKSGIKDIYVKSRARKSPHPLAAKDGADDGKAYSTAIQKSIDRQNRKLAKQGKSLGASAMGQTSVVPAQTRTQRLMSGAKRLPGRMGGLGGGMGLLGANMGLSMLPDFAGKGAAQGALAGANLGMMFGPKGMAAGAAIGLVTSAYTALIAKQKEHAAITKSVFSSSASEIEFFGGKVIDTTLKINDLGFGIKGITTIFGGLTPEVQALVNSINSLPDDDPLKMFVNSLKKLDSAQAVTGNIRAKVSEMISLGGLPVGEAKQTVAAMLEAAGMSSKFAEVWKGVQKSLSSETEATTAMFNKLNNALNTTNSEIVGNSTSWYEYDRFSRVVLKTYDQMNTEQKLVADSLKRMTGALTNGSLTADQFSARLNGIKNSAFNGVLGLQALRAAIVESGDASALSGFDSINFQLDQIGEKSLDALVKLMAVQNAGVTPQQAAGMLGKKYTAGNIPDSSIKGMIDTQLKLDAFSTKAFQKQMDDMAKAKAKIQAALGGTVPYRDPDDGTSAGKTLTAEERYLKILDKQIDALKAKQDAQKKANDETQREVDLINKLDDLASQATTAKLSGNYIEAAMLGRQSIQAQAEFDRETALNRQQDPIDKLIARKQEIQDGAKLTKAEKAQLPKKANGGLIKGPGTGRSDSIRATLGYAGGGSIRVSNGEFVVKAASVANYGIDKMNSVNNGTASIVTNSGGTSNTNVTMYVTGSNSDDIAKKVMVELDRLQKKNNKTNMVAK